MDKFIEKLSEIREMALEDKLNKTLLSVTNSELTTIITALKVYRNVDVAIDEELEIKLNRKKVSS